jgi:nitroreductase
MEAINAILTRRSIRRYNAQPVTEETIHLLLEAAMQSPTARNTQSWSFVVITNRTTLDSLVEIHPYAKMLKEAPLTILVCADLSLEEDKSHQCINCAAATQNILLAAHASGLGSVWLGVYPREERINPIKKLLNLAENILPMSLIAIGFPAEEKTSPTRYDEKKVMFVK